MLLHSSQPYTGIFYLTFWMFIPLISINCSSGTFCSLWEIKSSCWVSYQSLRNYSFLLEKLLPKLSWTSPLWALCVCHQSTDSICSLGCLNLFLCTLCDTDNGSSPLLIRSAKWAGSERWCTLKQKWSGPVSFATWYLITGGQDRPT